MREELINLNPPLPAVRKVKKWLVIGAISFAIGFFTLFSLVSFGTKKLVDEDEREQPLVTGKRVNSVSFLKLPSSYAELKKEEPPPAEEAKAAVLRGKEIRVQEHSRPPRVSHTTAIQQRATLTPEQQEEQRALRSNIFFRKSGQEPSAMKTAQAAVPAGIDSGTSKLLGDVLASAREQDASERRIDQRNKQDYLEDAEKQETAIYLNRRIQDPVSPYQIMAGGVLPAVLISGINSDLPGPIIAQVRENVFDSVTGNHLLIPQGTKLLGSYDSMVSWGQERVLLVWSRLIFPNGSSIVLDGMPGADLQGYAGLKDRVNNHYLQLAGAILMSTFLSVGTEYSQGDVEGFNPTVSQQIARELSGGINKAGQKIVDRQLNVPPTIEIKPGWPFNVMVNKDIVLRVYEDE